MIKYICTRCGKDTKQIRKLLTLKIVNNDDIPRTDRIYKHICSICANDIMEFVKRSNKK